MSDENVRKLVVSDAKILGQVAGLEALARAFIATHPNPQVLREVFDEMVRRQTDGFDEMDNPLTNLAEFREARTDEVRFLAEFIGWAIDENAAHDKPA